MKQVHPNYFFEASTKTITLAGLNISQDQLLLITNATRGVIYYNFASSSHRATVTGYFDIQGEGNTQVVLDAGTSTTGHADSDQLVIHYEDQLTTQTIAGLGSTADSAASSDTGTFSLISLFKRYLQRFTENFGFASSGVAGDDIGTHPFIALFKRHLQRFTTLLDRIPTLVSGRIPVDASGLSLMVAQPPSPYARLRVDIADTDGNAGYGTTGAPLKTVVSNAVAPDDSPIRLAVTAAIEPQGVGINSFISTGGSDAPAFAVGIGYNTESNTEFLAVNDSGNNLPVAVNNSVTIGAMPAINGTVTASSIQGTSVTTSNFTSTTASTVLASANAGRKVLTIFNEGAGNLHICAGATCTTAAYQVRLSTGDYYEVPLNQTSLAHSAIFATAGTARVTEVS